MKRYEPDHDDWEMNEDARGEWVAFTDVQALCREVLKFGLDHKLDCDVVHAVSCTCGSDAVAERLKAIADGDGSESKPQDGLHAIADVIQGWLDFNERPDATDDTHIMSPPVWPTRGTLKVWVKTLRSGGPLRSE